MNTMMGHNILADMNARVEEMVNGLLAFAVVDANNAKLVKAKIDDAKALKGEIEATHKQEKEPHLEAGRKVDAAYKPLQAAVEDAYKATGQKLAVFIAAERAAAEKIAAEERRKAEELAKAAQAEDAFLVDETIVATANTQAAIAENRAITAGRVTGGTGRAAGLREHRFAEVTDAKALVGFYAAHPDVLGAATKCANAAIRAAKGGPVNIPGVVVKTEERLA